jgi:glycosyltransferase involved in cell wall biosynthesis
MDLLFDKYCPHMNTTSTGFETTTRMNILHIAGKLDPRLGGVAQAIRTIVSGLDKLGFYNEVVSLDNPQAPFLKESPFVIHTPGEGQSAWYYSSGLKPWLKINYIRFDIVIVHGLWQYHGYALQRLFRQLKKRITRLPAVYVMPHGMLDPWFQAVRGRRVKAIRNWCYWKLIEKKLVNGADGILFTSLEEQTLASQPFRPYKPKHTAVVGLGVQGPPLFTENMQKAFLNRCPEVMNRNYLLFLGRIDEKKGVDLLLEAYDKIAVDYSVDNASENYQFPMLIIAGPGLDTPYGKKIKKIIATSRLLKFLVAFPGMLSGDAKWGAFYCADAFVLASHQENFGMALVEALACGTPVLISNKVNIWREVVETQGGLAEDDTAAGTLSLLNRWMTMRPEQQRLMGVRAKQCYESQFSVEMATKRMLRALGIDHKPAKQPSNIPI